MNALGYVIWSSDSILWILKNLSMYKRIKPPTSKEIETVIGLSSNSSILSENNLPSTRAGKTPITSFT
jgi:hypothetical protein